MVLKDPGLVVGRLTYPNLLKASWRRECQPKEKIWLLMLSGFHQIGWCNFS